MSERKASKWVQRAAALCGAFALVCLTAFPAGAAPAKGVDAAAIATKKAAIMNYVRALQQQQKTLVGVQVNEFEVYLDCTSAERLKIASGKHPAVLGLELMNAISVPPYGNYVLERAQKQTADGGLVALTWHIRNPTHVCVRGEFFDCTQTPMDGATLKKVLTKGTAEHKSWKADVAAIAKQLKKMRDRGIVVLFRPYHEMNGGWFWWGKQDLYPQLWDALYEELTVRHKLDNLIWVWSGDRDIPDAAKYAPAKHKPDIAGIDVYESDSDSPKFAAGRAQIATVFGHTPFALTEVGHLPSRAVIDAINPAWVLLWGGEFIDPALVMKGECKDCNSPAAVKQFIDYDRSLMLEDMPADVRAALSSGVALPRSLPKGTPACSAAHH